MTHTPTKIVSFHLSKIGLGYPLMGLFSLFLASAICQVLPVVEAAQTPAGSSSPGAGVCGGKGESTERASGYHTIWFGVSSSNELVTDASLLSFSITIPVQTFSNLQIRGQWPRSCGKGLEFPPVSPNLGTPYTGYSHSRRMLQVGSILPFHHSPSLQPLPGAQRTWVRVSTSALSKPQIASAHLSVSCFLFCVLIACHYRGQKHPRRGKSQGHASS